MAAASGRMAWLDVARGAAMLPVILTHAFAAVQTMAEPWRPLALANHALAAVLLRGAPGPLGPRQAVGHGAAAAGVGPAVGLRDLDAADLRGGLAPPAPALGAAAARGGDAALGALRQRVVPLRAAACPAIAALHVWAAGGTDPLAAADVPLRLSDYALGAFMLGVWTAPWVVAALARPGAVRAAFVGGAALWLGAMGLRMADLEPPTLVSALPGMAAALALSTWLAAVGPLRRALGWVGRRTLEIFLAHQAFVALGLAAATALGLGPNAALAWVFAAATAGAIGYAALAEAGPLRRLTRPPAPARRAAAGAAT